MEALSEYLKLETLIVFLVFFGIALASVAARSRWHARGAFCVFFAVLLLLEAVLLTRTLRGGSLWLLLLPLVTLAIALLPAWLIKRPRYALMCSAASSVASTVLFPWLLWGLMCAGETCY